jgi:hypothetical protein
MEGIDLKNVVTTVYNEFLEKDSGIAAQFRWGNNERVRFCDSVEEMEHYAKELDFPELRSSRQIISFDEEHQLLPYEILSALELSNWRKPDTIALVKLNKKSIRIYVKYPFDFTDRDVKHYAEKAKEEYDRYARNSWRYDSLKAFMLRNALSGVFCDSYPE